MNYIASILTRIRLHLICFVLWLIECWRRRELKLTIVSQPAVMVISSHPFKMLWQVKGCYKIVINGRFVIPGNRNAVLLNPEQLPDVFEIRFLGCTRQLVHRFHLNKHKLILKDPVTCLPSPAAPTLVLTPHPVLSVNQLRLLLQQPSLAKSLAILIPPITPLVPGAPELKLQLEPYHLQPTQPEYETTVL